MRNPRFCCNPDDSTSMKYADKGERIDDLRLILERVAEVSVQCIAAASCMTCYSMHCWMSLPHHRALLPHLPICAVTEICPFGGRWPLSLMLTASASVR
jgi:hypothetical protein